MKVTQSGFIEGDAPAIPPSGIVTIYAKEDGLMYSKDSNGTEVLMGTPVGAGTVTNVSSANGDITVATGSTTPVLTLVQAPALKSATTTVDVASASAPTAGQVLTATGGSAATWQSPSIGGAAEDLESATTTINVSAAAAPTTGQVLTATSSTTATWQTPAVSGTNPKFSAVPTSNQGLSAATTTKVTFGTEQFDTNSNFASSRFTPTVEGYYQINAGLYVTGISGDLYLFLRKNGTTNITMNYSIIIDDEMVVGAYLIYLNGSTDYVEIFTLSNQDRTIITSSYFQGFKVA